MNKKEILKKWLPYGIILGIVLLAEVFWFNFSTWATMSCEPVVLAENVVTDEKGIYETELTTFSCDVKNINVNLTIERYDRAKVKVMLTDAGDYYEYALPEYEVVSGLKGDGYQNIYPFGEVNTLRVIVTVPEGTVGHIESIAANDNRPMDFKILRVIVLFAVFSLGYLLFADRPLLKIKCERGNRKQLLAIAAVIFVVLMLGGLLVMSNPVWRSVPWQHHKQYQELAQSMAKGSVVIGEKPDPALLAKENPYDTSALLAEEIPFNMDYALYDGNYYAYFGIVPEVLFFLPYHLLTGKDLPNYLVVFAFYGMMVTGIFGLLWEVIQRFFQKVPFVWYLIMASAVSLLPNYVFTVGRPDIYNIPVIAGNAFAFLGAFFWARAVWNEKHRKCRLALGSLCIACIMGCRPQMILYGVVFFCVLFVPLLLKKQWRSSLSWKDAVSFCVPVVLVGILVFWYNLARFDSGFDFGATYSLTSNDMNNRGFNFSRVFRGMYSFFFQPPNVHASFPFLESGKLEGSYMGKNIVEFCYGGIFIICPWVWSIMYAVLGGYKKLSRELNGWIAGLCGASVIIAIFDINAAGVLQRYMGDMVLGLVLAAVMVIFYLLDLAGSKAEPVGDVAELAGGVADRAEARRWISKIVYITVIVGLIFSFLIFITSEDNICLQEYDPVLFHRIWSYFKF